MTNEARQRDILFELAGVGVVETDLSTGRLVRANETFCEWVGYSEVELQKLTYLELTHPDDRGRDAASFAALSRGEQQGGTSLTRLVRKDGQVVWLELQVTLVPDGDHTRNLTVATDVTERRRAAGQARRAAARDAFRVRLNDALRPLADPARIQGEACRLLGDYLGVDRAYYLEADEGAGHVRVYQDYLRGDSPSLAGTVPLADYGWVVPYLLKGEAVVVEDVETSDFVSDADRQALAAFQIAAHITVPLVKAGAWEGALCVTETAPRAWLEADVDLVRETAERLWATIERGRAEVALRDLNEILEARVEERSAALARSNLRFSQAFYLNPVPACMTTLGRETFVEVNDAFLALTGYAREEVVGRTAWELGMWSSPGDQRKVDTVLAQQRGFRELDLQVRHQDGGVHDVLLSAETIRLDGHEGYLKMFYDVTDRKRTEEQTHRAIQEVMSDTNWFSQRVMERLAQIRTGGATTSEPVELTRRERDVLERLARGVNNEVIAAELGVAVQTVRNYISAVYDKLGVRTRAEAIVWARERGIVG